MRIALIGANGQLGTDCARVFEAAGDEVVPLNHTDVDIADAGRTADALRDARPDAIVNTAAMHDVERCEDEPDLAFAVNAVGARNLARAAAEVGAVLLHVSTDYVFAGDIDRPYVEADLPRPLNSYGNSKLAGEYYVLAEARRGIVVRTSGLYGRSPCRAKQGGLNFVQLMLRLARERGTVKVVTDQVVTPTYTYDLARQIRELLGSELYGVVHATAGGQCSWYDFAAEIFRIAGVEVELQRADSADFPSRVARPAFSVLDNARLRDAGLDVMPDWVDSLRAYLEEIGEAAATTEVARGR